MKIVFVFSMIYLFGEVVAFFIFKTLNYLLEKRWEFRVNVSVVKGMIERLFMFLALVYNLPHALIAFGAIKIGTRIKPDEKISNDYFFIGNMISLTVIIIYYALWKVLSRS